MQAEHNVLVHDQKVRAIPVITQTVCTSLLREMSARTSVPSKNGTCEKMKNYVTYKAVKI